MSRIASICLLISFHLYLNVNGQNKIVVTITNLRNNNGHVLISLYDSDKGWSENKDSTLRKVEIPIQNKTASITFNNISQGVYAVAMMHDENDNIKMDKTFLGMPKEGYGFSNNVMGTFGPPGFKEASFKHDINTEVKIKVRY